MAKAEIRLTGFVLENEILVFEIVIFIAKIDLGSSTLIGTQIIQFQKTTISTIFSEF